MMKDTDHHITKFISSQQMESLEIRKRIIKLGEELVKRTRFRPRR